MGITTVVLAASSWDGNKNQTGSLMLIPGPGLLEARESAPLVFMVILRLREKQALESYCGTENFGVLMLPHLLYDNPSDSLTECCNGKGLPGSSAGLSAVLSGGVGVGEAASFA